MSAAHPRFHRLAVNDVRREAADAVSLSFAIPNELADDYRFLPGQYLTLRTTMDGEEVRRSYSICSGPDDGELRIAIKKVDGGAFSTWAAEELRAGHELEVMTPTGRFAITDKLRFTDHSRAYGWGAIALTGHQTHIEPGWKGGDRLAIHGTSDQASIGLAASFGCLRARDADVRWLVHHAYLGSVMTIRP